MGSLFGGGMPGGGQAQTYVQPVAPGTLQQTIISGAPNPRGAAPPAGETEEERRRRLAAQSNILGGETTGLGDGGAADGGGTGPGDGGSGAAAP